MDKYYSKEFRPDKWMIYPIGSNIPIHDNSPDGKDKPLVFSDLDSVSECLNKLNLNEIRSTIN